MQYWPALLRAASSFPRAICCRNTRTAAITSAMNVVLNASPSLAVIAPNQACTACASSRLGMSLAAVRASAMPMTVPMNPSVGMKPSNIAYHAVLKINLVLHELKAGVYQAIRLGHRPADLELLNRAQD